MEDSERPVRRKSCLRVGLTVIIAVFALPVLLITAGVVTTIWAMIHPSQVSIELPDRSGKVTFSARLSHPIVAEYDRKITIRTKKFPSTTMLAPMDTCGSNPTKVYWFPANKQEGPYLRFRDPANEYVLDLKHGGLRPMGRFRSDMYLGYCTKSLPNVAMGVTEYENGCRIRFTGNTKPAQTTTGILSQSKGKYLGSIHCSAFGSSFDKNGAQISK